MSPDPEDLLKLAGYALGIGVFLAMRRHGFWGAAAAAGWAVTVLVIAGMAVLVGGNLTLLAASTPLLVAVIIYTFAPLALLLPALHGVLLWAAKRRRAMR